MAGTLAVDTDHLGRTYRIRERGGGRRTLGAARFATATVSVLVAILLGVWLLRLPIDPRAVNWPLFIATLAVGVVMLASFGLLLASVVLLVTHQSWTMSEAIAGTLCLFSGAVFPLEVLPQWLRPIGYAMPLTYWLELLRRSLMGSVAGAFPTFAALGSVQLLGVLVGLTTVFAAFAAATFRTCDLTARERGLIDRMTGY